MKNFDLRKIDLNLLLIFQVLMQERSVSKAAEILGRTQSTVSHALARLREQLDDPLLIKSGSGMLPSDRAVLLYEDIQPLLRHMQRILSPKETFDASTSNRTFRIGMPDFSMDIFTQLIHRLHRTAPNITLEWIAPQPNLLLEIAEGLLDLALIPSDVKLNEEISATSVGLMRWQCFLRTNHPALKQWDADAWQSYPHIAVRIGDKMRSPVESALNEAHLQRRVQVWVPHFSAVAPLLEQSDAIATLPTLCLSDLIDRYQIVAVEPPFHIADMSHQLIWGKRQSGDAGTQWLKSMILDVLGDFFESPQHTTKQ